MRSASHSPVGPGMCTSHSTTMYGGGAQSQQRSRRIRRWDHHVTLGFENPSRKLVDGDVIVDDHDGARLFEGEISPSSIEGVSREHQRSIIRHDAIATAS